MDKILIQNMRVNDVLVVNEGECAMLCKIVVNAKMFTDMHRIARFDSITN
ncbi:MAG TPA: hypothetical protein VF318_02985 [Dehalococcoidales bacterium]